MLQRVTVGIVAAGAWWGVRGAVTAAAAGARDHHDGGGAWVEIGGGNSRRPGPGRVGPTVRDAAAVARRRGRQPDRGPALA